MPSTRVSPEQFEVKNDVVIHTPSGAKFTAYPGYAEPHNVNWGKCGDVLANGDDYGREDVYQWAKKLLRERLQKKK
jgi:hypothetical protein